MQQEDTIAAVATPPGVGGVGIVRLSGDEALVIADRMFRARNGKRLTERSRTRRGERSTRRWPS